MAVVLQSATNPRGAGCDHRVCTVNVDSGAQIITVTVKLSEITTPITAEEVETVLRLWARYQRSKGVPVASLIGATIFPNIP